jgi:hypothetical protein
MNYISFANVVPKIGDVKLSQLANIFPSAVNCVVYNSNFKPVKIFSIITIVNYTPLSLLYKAS